MSSTGNGLAIHRAHQQSLCKVTLGQVAGQTTGAGSTLPTSESFVLINVVLGAVYH